MSELLLCPFCGGTMMFRKALWPSDGCTDAIIHAEPPNCGLVEYSDGTIDESILTKWNTRSSAETARKPFDRELVNSQCKLGDYCKCCGGKPRMCPNYEGPGAVVGGAQV